MQGKTISGYTLQRLLGTGGMAEVWYAESKIGTKAAVKIMSEKLSHDDSMQERFLNEAKVMVMLDHPNIRKVYGFDEIDGRPAIVMEYLDGSDLKARMKGGQRFTQEELEKWWNQLADALNYTHSMDIVHRDIKPSNIFIDQRGNAKLLDFGIAKVADTTTGTLTGSTLGTRIYMSPEQVRDPKRVGPPSDVYSLAVRFVHLLTGKAPYDSTTSSDYDIQESIVRKPLDMSKVPDTWRGFLLPYLEKDPAKRPALRPFETNAPSSAPSSGGFASRPKGDGDFQSPTDDEGTLVNDAPKKQEPQRQGPKKTQPIAKTEPKVEGNKPKSKKGFWIGFAVVAVAAIVAALLWLRKPTGSTNGHEWVDLGLPSGTLWATCNIGASSPEGYGNYYAWGETSTKVTYDWSTYRYGNGDKNRLTKYCNRSDYGNNGVTDNLTTLQSGDDPATANWGSGWCTPSKAQWDELLANTTNQWTKRSGVRGRLFTSKKNGQTLFLPAAGFRGNSSLNGAGSGGYYWSSSLDAGSPGYAWNLDFISGSYYVSSYYYRYYGLSVRPVCSSRQN